MAATALTSLRSGRSAGLDGFLGEFLGLLAFVTRVRIMGFGVDPLNIFESLLSLWLPCCCT